MTKVYYQFSFSVLLCSIILLCCQKAPKTTVTPVLSTVSTDSVTNITFNTASVFTRVINDGGSPVTSRGVCWNTASKSTTSDSKTIDGAGTGTYKSNLTGLNDNTTYYLRPYTINSVGTSYGTEITFTTSLPGVVIDSLQWMLNNLEVTRYSNGDIIPQVTDSVTWGNLTTGAWCYYNNDSLNGAKYGKLYNWYAVNDARGLAPKGWHIPTKEEFIKLVSFLGGDIPAGGKMKATVLWDSPNTGGTNESGFTGLPGGLRSNDATFSSIGKNGYWWTTKEHDAATAVERSLAYDLTDCYMYFLGKTYGMSVRCVKN